MYAIVKTGGKQYKVAAGDFVNVEKLDVEEGKKVALDAICIVDGDKVETDPAKASKTKVEAVVVEQFRGDKQLVFKFKKRKNYKKLRGHRQNLTRLRIETVGTEKAPAAKKPAAKTAAKKADAKPAAKTTAAKTTAAKTTAAKSTAAKSTTKTTAAKSTAAKTTAAKSTAAKPAEKKTAAKPAAKKTTAKKATTADSDAE